MPETRTVKGFSEDGLPLAEGDFECCTFDHSDNSPYLFSSVLSSKKLLENSLGRKQERKQKIFDFEIFCVEEHQGEAGGRNSQIPPKFQVSPVMTTSIPLHMMQRHLFYYTPQENARVWRKAIGKKAKLFAKNEKKQLTISV